MANDLVERLRAGEDGLELAAADEIESLEKDKELYKNVVDRLTTQLAKSFGIEHLGWLEHWESRAKAAEDTIKRLKNGISSDKASQETSDS